MKSGYSSKEVQLLWVVPVTYQYSSPGSKGTAGTSIAGRNHSDGSSIELNDRYSTEIERQQKENLGSTPPVAPIPTDVQSSDSPFSQNDLNHVLSQWQSVLRNQHVEFERREGERKRQNGELKESCGSDCNAKVIDRFRTPNHILRNWSSMLASASYQIRSTLTWYTPQVEQISRQMRHLTTLNMSLVCCMVHLIHLTYLILQIQTMDVDVSVHTWQLRTLLEDSRERMENFVRYSLITLNLYYLVPNNFLGIYCKENTNQILGNRGQAFYPVLRHPHLFILMHQSDEELETEVCPMKLRESLAFYHFLK